MFAALRMQRRYRRPSVVHNSSVFSSNQSYSGEVGGERIINNLVIDPAWLVGRRADVSARWKCNWKNSVACGLVLVMGGFQKRGLRSQRVVF